MAYNPGISYQGSNYLYQALSSLGDDAAQAIKDRQEQDKVNAYNEAIVQNALKNGDITLDDYNKFNDMAGKQKTGFAAGLAANVHDKWNRMKDQATVDAENARTATLRAQLNQTGPYEAPDQGQGDKIWDAQGNEIGIYDAQGQPHFYPGGSAGGSADVKVLALTDPGTGKTVPNRGIIDKTGQVVDTSADMPSEVIKDPSGKFYLDNKTKSWKPIPATTMFTPDATPTPTPAAAGVAIVKVSSPADAMSLPPGTRYQTPDGRTFVR